jgi:hypothetical protein
MSYRDIAKIILLSIAISAVMTAALTGAVIAGRSWLLP